VSFIGVSLRLPTASRAVTTEAPHWPNSRRGRSPSHPEGRSEAATVTLFWRTKSSPFWIIFLLTQAEKSKVP
jgi:hypothetical protein